MTKKAHNLNAPDPKAPAQEAAPLGREYARTLPEQIGRSDETNEILSRESTETQIITVEQERFLPPRVSPFERFDFIGELGRGGMGRVVDAYDREMGRRIAVKYIASATKNSRLTLSRFLGEARLAAQLDHPNIVPIYELGLSQDGLLFFVMKRVQGRSLREVIELLYNQDSATKRAWGRHRCLTAFVQVCNALAYAHERGVVHRDLKPENIMVGEFGEVLVMDWGVARLLGEEDIFQPGGPLPRDEESQTEDGVAIGTPGYMSPEQALGRYREISPKSDVWALGTILYELLTLQPAYCGDPKAQMLACVAGPPPPPSQRSPGLRIPERLSEICIEALARSPEDRPSARQLAGAIEAFLDGAERHQRAAQQVLEAEALWRWHTKVKEERSKLLNEIQSLEEKIPPWTPIAEKSELIEGQRRAHELAIELAEAFEGVVAACERALSHDPHDDAAHDLLADAYWHKMLEADAKGDGPTARYYAGRVRAHDCGPYIALLDGDGSLSIQATPQSTRIFSQRFERNELVWRLGAAVELGAGPLDEVVLPNGSYLLTLEQPGKQAISYPAHIARGRHWNAADTSHPFYSAAEIGEGWRYIPAGPFVCGGDPHALESLPRSEPFVGAFFIQELPVSVGEYCAFLNHLHQVDPEQAWRRSPRESSGVGADAGQLWQRPQPQARYQPPQHHFGLKWNEDWPIFAISWDDAMAYAEWMSRQTGINHRLPREIEWEKAARGVDGRAFPWGDRFDPTLCHMQNSLAKNQHPSARGRFAHDRSVYGVRDLAGGVAEWCLESAIRGDQRRRVARGGSWLSTQAACRLASRRIVDLGYVYPSIGFRLIRGMPLSQRQQEID